MSGPSTNQSLCTALAIGCHPHYRGAWQPAHSLRINSGVERVENVFLPKTDWRSLTTAELSRLVSSTAGCADIELLTLPNHLYHAFWSLDVAALASHHAEPTTDEKYLQFARELTDFFRFIEPRIDARAVVQSEISAPDLRTTNPLAHTASGHGFRVTDEQQCWILTNFGDEPRSLIVLNLTLNQMRQQLLERNLHPPPAQDEQTVLEAFFDHCSDYPLLGLTLGPQEGVLIANQRVAYDGDTTSMSGPDIATITTTAPADHNPNQEKRQ